MAYVGQFQDLGSSINGIPKNITGFYDITLTLTPTAVSANTTSEQMFAYTTAAYAPLSVLQVGDSLDINKATHQAGVGIVNVRVSAPGTLAITYMNSTASSITPATEAYIIGGMR